MQRERKSAFLDPFLLQNMQFIYNNNKEICIIWFIYLFKYSKTVILSNSIAIKNVLQILKLYLFLCLKSFVSI